MSYDGYLVNDLWLNHPVTYLPTDPTYLPTIYWPTHQTFLQIPLLIILLTDNLLNDKVIIYFYLFIFDFDNKIIHLSSFLLTIKELQNIGICIVRDPTEGKGFNTGVYLDFYS